MNISRKTLFSYLWFALEVIGIFVLIQVIRFVIGKLDAIYSGLALLLIAAVLFVIAFLITRNKDHQNPRKPRAKTFTGLLG